MGASEPWSRREELEDARDLLATAAAAFVRWEKRLEDLVERLPDPQVADETGDPLNVTGAVQGLVEAMLYDELRPAVDLLRQAAAWLDDPESWVPPSPN